MDHNPRGSRTVYHDPPLETIPIHAARARDLLAEHVLEPRSGECRVCRVPGPCAPADAAIAALVRLGVRLPGAAHLVPVDGPTVVLTTVPPARQVVEPDGEGPGRRDEPPPGVDPLDWRLAVRLRRDHRADEAGTCPLCGHRCLARWLVDRVLGSGRADRLRLELPGPRTRRVPGAAGRTFALPNHRGAPGGWGAAA
jgi:hypothetical protein